jgi:predicted metal-dependent hydrolase
VPVVKYGTREITFTHQIDDTLKHAYITVDFYEGVILKSPRIDDTRARELIYKKGRWVLEKSKIVERIPQGPITTGSRLLYLGKRYYVQVVQDENIPKALVRFNYSKFTITVNPNLPDRASAIDCALEEFSRKKAVIKISPRIKKWSETIGLSAKDIKFRKLSKRWGSCTRDNEVIINFDAIKLPFTLIDYIVVHELVHIRHKDHSKDFYKELSRYFPGWEELDDKLCGMRL